MLRVLIYALAILHLGPGFAFAVLAFGCEPSAPLLGTLCEQSSMAAFVWMTLGAWGVMILALVLKHLWRRHTHTAATGDAR
ncbi:MAG: hypothetical protein ACOYNB_12085 [Aquabacterium sp.]|uniref:hypothetical protein n=1 Tax=Aquabacterium sp. TaxID=1872578 RepID=UPI003BD8C9B2